MLRTRMTTLVFLLLELSTVLLFLELISCPLCNANALRNILIVFSRNVEPGETCCVQE